MMQTKKYSVLKENKLYKIIMTGVAIEDRRILPDIPNKTAFRIDPQSGKEVPFNTKFYVMEIKEKMYKSKSILEQTLSQLEENDFILVSKKLKSVF